MKLATNAARGGGDEARRRAHLEDAAVDDHADPVGERGGVLEVVRHEHRREAELGEHLVQLGADGACVCASSAESGSSSRSAGRLAGERARERDPLPLASRELAHTRARELCDPEPLEQLVERRAVRRAEADVRGHVEVREERVLLEEVADAPPLGRTVDARARVEPGLAVDGDPCPRRAQSSPAMTRSMVVLPAPDGPTSASVSPSSTVSSTAASKVRRGWVSSSRSAIA